MKTFNILAIIFF